MAQQLSSEQPLAGGLLILGSLLSLAGAFLWMGRNLWNWPPAEAANYLGWERGLITAGIVVMLLGLVLLEDLLRAAGDPVWARLALATFLVGAVLGIVAEGYAIGRMSYPYAWIVIYVVLAFLAQAAFGASLLQTGLVAPWIGWMAIIWNLAWLIVLPILSPRDIYYPVLHDFAPLIIGIALLLKR